MRDKTFANEFLGRLLAQLGHHEAHPMAGLTESDIELSRTPCDIVDRLRGQADLDFSGLAARMDTVINLAYDRMSSPSFMASFFWRKLYTDACVVKVLLLLTDSELHEATARTSIATLDRAIILAGAPGDASLGLILDMIRWIQSHTHWKDHGIGSGHHEFTAGREVTIWSRSPFVLKGFVSDWPAVKHWTSADYLYSVAGPGRIVPVEIGNDYRSDDWTQELLGWEDCLSALTASDSSQRHPLPVFYLAQHNLLQQFPILREDITVPDYVYMSPGPPVSYPNYRPPSNEDQLVINVWFGPKGTISPAHTDPFFNCYAQVVGRKTVWLAPPEIASSMYPCGPSLAGTDDIHHPAANTTEPLMSNTSRVDVFPASKEVQEAVTLDPGDLLFFPPGWWHAMRSDDVSFSVSMWF
ncbi:Clavaminate synthase-like protein [Pisolithus marmoratus]|nr:Clavaminate synthase-like protein [Pisolithus marmoratus]